MADEELRLVAQFTDRMSPGLKSATDKIRQFSKDGEKSSREGESSTKKHAEAFAKLRDRIKETVALSRDHFLPGLEKTAFAVSTAGTGIGALTTAIGLAAAAAKNFGESMLDLSQASHLTGMTNEQIRFWENLGEYAGVAAEQVKAAAGEFNVAMDLMERRPDTWKFMMSGPDRANFAPLISFAQTLKGLSRDDQMRKMLDQIRNIVPVGQQRGALELFKIPEGFAKLLPELMEYEKRAGAADTPFSPEQIKAGADAQKNWIQLKQTMQDLSLVIGARFSPAMSEATAELTAWITANQGAWSDEAGKWFSTAIEDAKIFGGWLDIIVKDLNAIMDWEKKLPVLLDILKALKEGADKWERNPDGSIKTAPHVPNYGPWHGGGSPSGPIITDEDLKRKREQFEKLNPGGLIHKSAFIVGGDGGSGGGLSKGTSDMINIIAAGTRRGTYDALMDFTQTAAAAGGGGGGGGGGIGGFISKASFGAGGGGAGGALSGIRARAIGGKLGGNEAALAQQGYDYWRSQGLSRDQALQVLGNQRGENQLGALSAGDGGRSVGQFQWSASRRAEILNATGIDVRTAGFLDQQRAARWEFEKGSQGGHIWNSLRNSRSNSESMGLLVHRFERSANQASDIATRMGFADRYGRSITDKPPAIAGSGAPGHAAPFHMPARPGHFPGASQEASLLRASRQANAGVSKVQGEASLSIKLAGGLTMDGGAKNKGDLFKEIKISRGSVPYASTES